MYKGKGDIIIDNKNKKKIEIWRIILFIASILFIVFMLVRKDIVTIYTTMPATQVIPMIATTITVSLLKAAAFAGSVILIKWFIGKLAKHTSE